MQMEIFDLWCMPPGEKWRLQKNVNLMQKLHHKAKNLQEKKIWQSNATNEQPRSFYWSCLETCYKTSQVKDRTGELTPCADGGHEV